MQRSEFRQFALRHPSLPQYLDQAATAFSSIYPIWFRFNINNIILIIQFQYKFITTIGEYAADLNTGRNAKARNEKFNKVYTIKFITQF